MRKMVVLALLGLGLAAVEASANGPGGAGGFSWRVNVRPIFGPGYGLGTPQQLGPWYLYWPYEGHFQTPALPQYPYWPMGQTLPPGLPLTGPAMMGGPSMGPPHGQPHHGGPAMMPYAR